MKITLNLMNLDMIDESIEALERAVEKRTEVADYSRLINVKYLLIEIKKEYEANK